MEIFALTLSQTEIGFLASENAKRLKNTLEHTYNKYMQIEIYRI